MFGVRASPGGGHEPSADGGAPTRPAWHQLHTRDLEAAWALYAGTFGWAHRQTLEARDVDGGYRLFSWSPDGAIVGGVGNTARRAGVHAHWMFCFPVAELDAAAERVRTLGGTAMAPVALPDGRRVVGCEDPQGAAFGLVERARRTEATASSA